MENILADALTKPFTKDRHKILTRAMGLEAFDYSQSEDVKCRASYYS